jgi:hypothetical protein
MDQKWNKNLNQMGNITFVVNKSWLLESVRKIVPQGKQKYQ